MATPLALVCSMMLAAAATEPAAGTNELSWLIGEWRGKGTSFGDASSATLELRPAVGGKFLELKYSVRTTGAKPLSFEGRAFYTPLEKGKWQAWWFDSQGVHLPISATLEKDQLTAEWGAAGTRRGRTVYRRLADGRIEVIDWSAQTDGSLQAFARQQFKKSD